MSNVIGYKGTATERWEDWLLMLAYKEGQRVLTDKQLQKNEQRRFNTIIDGYVRRAA